MHSLKVTGMSCGHCVRAITRAVRGLDEMAAVQVDLATGVVRITSRLELEQLLELIRAEGYGAEPA